MAEGGWIKLHWKAQQSAVFSNGRTWAVWTRILLSCSCRRQMLRNGTVLGIGECVVSTKELAEWAECSQSTMKRILNSFEAEGMISVQKKDRNGTHLSVVNWRLYQNSAAADGPQQVSNERETDEQRMSNGCQTKSKKSNKSPKKNTGGRFATPSVADVRSYCEERRNSVDPQAFVDFYESKGWKVGNQAMRDWRAAVRTWERNSDTNRGSPSRPSRKSIDFEELLSRGER